MKLKVMLCGSFLLGNTLFLFAAKISPTVVSLAIQREDAVSHAPYLELYEIGRIENQEIMESGNTPNYLSEEFLFQTQFGLASVTQRVAYSPKCSGRPGIIGTVNKPTLNSSHYSWDDVDLRARQGPNHPIPDRRIALAIGGAKSSMEALPKISGLSDMPYSTVNKSGEAGTPQIHQKIASMLNTDLNSVGYETLATGDFDSDSYSEGIFSGFAANKPGMGFSQERYALLISRSDSPQMPIFESTLSWRPKLISVFDVGKYGEKEIALWSGENKGQFNYIVLTCTYGSCQVALQGELRGCL